MGPAWCRAHRHVIDRAKGNTMKKISAAIAAIVLGFGLASVTASPAAAAKSDCPAANLCIWDSVNYAGSRWNWTIGYIRTLPSDCLVLPSAANNKASSVFLNGTLTAGWTVKLWDGNNSGAARNIVTSNYSDANMLTSPGMSNFSNLTSSICVQS